MGIIAIKGFSDLANLKENEVDNYLSNHSFQSIQSLVKEVLLAAPKCTPEPSLAQFIKKIELIELKLNDNLSLTELKKCKDQLRAFVPSPVKSESVANSVKHFEMLMNNTTQTTSSSLVKTKQKNPSLETLERIRTNIQSLQLDDKNLESKIVHIKSDIESLEGKSISKEQAECLKLALNLLTRNHVFYKPTLFEEKIYNLLAGSYTHTFAKVFEANRDKYIPLTADKYRSALLEILAQKSSSIESWVGQINVFTKDAESILIQRRVEYFFSQGYDLSHYLGASLPTHLRMIVKAFKNLSLNIACPYFNSEWSKLKESDPNLYSAPFLDLLKNYPQCDPSQFIPEFLELVQARYFKMLDVEKLVHLNAEELKKTIALADEKMLRADLRSSFDKMFRVNCFEQHLWMQDNFEKIKLRYNQSSDIHRNQDGGTCLQNSLERVSSLIENPLIESAKIPMGSTPRGRNIRAGINLAYKKMSQENANEFQLKTAEKFGLKSIYRVRIGNNESKSSAHSSIIEMWKECGKKSGSNFQCVLILYNGPDAHAFNIQTNKSAKIIRFMDDNLGVCEFNDRADFEKQFVGYLKAFYPEYKDFYLELYKKS